MYEMGRIIDGQATLITELRSRVRDLERSAAYHDGPNTLPPSQNSPEARRSKGEARVTDRPHRSSGGRPGHGSASHGRKVDRAERHTPEECGCKGASVSRTDAELVIDIDSMPEATTICHVVDTITCADCVLVTDPGSRGIRGAPIARHGIADAYGGAGHGLGITPGNAAGCLSASVTLPGMPPTNNESEKILSWIVIRHRICERIATAGHEGIRDTRDVPADLENWGRILWLSCSGC